MGVRIEWLTAEANGGNMNAMYRLAVTADRDSSGPEIPADALAWYRKAAALGHSLAKQRLASHEFRLGNLEASAAAFQEAFQLRPPVASTLAMWYAAAARSGNRAAALEQLKVWRDKVGDNYAWGSHMLDFHLDKISRDKLFKYAVEDDKQSVVRLCEAHFQLGQYELIAGQKDAARAAFEQARDTCPASERESYLAPIELARLDGAAR